MIKVLVKGDAYPIRKALKDNLFRYNEFDRCWYRQVEKCDLNRVLDTLKPMPRCDEYPQPNYWVEVKKTVDEGFF